MREINPTVRVIGHEAGKNSSLEEASAVHPGAPLGTSTDSAQQNQQTQKYLDLGPYALDKAETVSLDQPSTLPGFTTQGIVSDLGAGVVRGDGPNALAPEHAESQRLADVLNRLAANQLDGAQRFAASLTDVPTFNLGRNAAATEPLAASAPEQLMAALQATGHNVTVDDARYFANFGHFHYKGHDVMMPFFLNSQIIIPNSGGRPLLVPAAHAEYEWHIRGPRVNADVSYYFGIDGKSQWRTMDTLDQAWVLKRNAHEYTGADAVEVTRLAGLMTVAYAHLHAKYPSIPFGGYYALGVCQDGVSAIEQKMTGHVTLFPNTADELLFNDPRDGEINALINAIPKDREGAKPQPERIFGSLPTEDFNAITIPGLGDDLKATHDAWQAGTLERTSTTMAVLKAILFIGSAFAVAMYLAVITLRFQNKHGRQRPQPR